MMSVRLVATASKKSCRMSPSCRAMECLWKAILSSLDISFQLGGTIGVDTFPPMNLPCVRKTRQPLGFELGSKGRGATVCSSQYGGKWVAN